MRSSVHRQEWVKLVLLDARSENIYFIRFYARYADARVSATDEAVKERSAQFT